MFPCLHPDGSDIHPEAISPRQALEMLVPAVMNLDRIDDDGWRALCQAAERCHIRLVHHPDAVRTARFLIG